MELLDRPFFNWHLGIALSKGYRGLLSTEIRRDEKQCRFAWEAVGERLGLGVAELRQRIDDMVRWYAARIRDALAMAPDYLGVVASRKRFAAMRETLLSGGVSAAAIDSIRSPAGLNIKAERPEEIALSILAEIVELSRERPAAQDASEPAAVGDEAIDPICGMTVTIAGARHTAEHAGRTWYFCCGGCRERFLAAPESYILQEGAA